MSVTSTTGKGTGAASPNKGPKNGRNNYVSVLTPHIVAAGHVTLAGGTATVTFPTPLEAAAANYAVVASPQAAATTVWEIPTKTDVSGKFASFVITGDNIAFAWMVAKVGNP